MRTLILVAALLCDVRGRELLVSFEEGGAAMLDPATGKVVRTYETGSDAFGAAFAPDGRAFVTDRKDGTLVELAAKRSIAVGRGAQQPAIAADGRVFVPLAGEAAIAVVIDGRVARRIDTGAGTKPHIVSLSPDGRTLWATVQGRDPKVMAIDVTDGVEKPPREHRYDLVPRVIFATNDGAYFTAHHSTGVHRVKGDVVSTPYLDENGTSSEPRKQIEGVAASDRHVALTHEGRKVLVVLDGEHRKIADIALSAPPYWVTFDPSGSVMYVSIPSKGLVEAYTIGGKQLWSAAVGGKPKRMAVR
jgi:DNA-binding beta-propeller fold protein YncE